MSERKRVLSCPPNNEIAPADLDTYPQVRMPLSGKRVRAAPDGFQFEVGGKFTIHGNSSVDIMMRPVDSREKFLSVHGERFEPYLSASDGNWENAWQAYVDEDLDEGEVPPLTFQGSYIEIESEQQGIGDGKFETGSPVVVWERMEATAEIGDEYCLMASTGGLVRSDTIYNASGIEISWGQRFVKALPEDVTLSLVETSLDRGELYRPNFTFEPDLFMPWTGRPTLNEYVDYYGFGMNRSISEEEKLSILRAKRMEGDPFEDDPLPDLIFPNHSLILPLPIITKPYRNS